MGALERLDSQKGPGKRIIVMWESSENQMTILQEQTRDFWRTIQRRLGVHLFSAGVRRPLIVVVSSSSTSWSNSLFCCRGIHDFDLYLGACRQLARTHHSKTRGMPTLAPGLHTHAKPYAVLRWGRVPGYQRAAGCSVGHAWQVAQAVGALCV